jgi:transketolase
MKEKKIKYLEKKVKWVRNKILEMTVKAGAGHIAPSFSCSEILAVLYYGEILRIRPKNPNWPQRDRFILSKGQAAVALYAILADLGFLPESDLCTFTQKGSCLGGHAENTIPGIEAFTGSLGHGLSIGAGLALGAKLNKQKWLTVTLLGDGECHEGSVWEAAMFASHHHLNNLVSIIDHNGLCATDFLESCLKVDPLQKKWEAFGWDTVMVDGHSLEKLLMVLLRIRKRRSNKPLAIVAITTKGKGVSFMENKPLWHYRVPHGKELDTARKELV